MREAQPCRPDRPSGARKWKDPERSTPIPARKVDATAPRRTREPQPVEALRPESARNPPEGPQPISTPKKKNQNPTSLPVAIPRRVLSRFPLDHARGGARRSDNVAIPRRVLSRFPLQASGRAQGPRHRVAIPRRVLSRFPPSGFEPTTNCPPSRRNPPKGPQPISTRGVEMTARAIASGRNPPKGPQPISTKGSQAKRAPCAHRSQSPEGSSADFHRLCCPSCRTLGPPARSQSPEGSSADFHGTMGSHGKICVTVVAIPRRVLSRFPREAVTKAKERTCITSQSPEGSSADFHCGPVNPPGISYLQGHSANLAPRGSETCRSPVRHLSAVGTQTLDPQ